MGARAAHDVEMDVEVGYLGSTGPILLSKVGNALFRYLVVLI